MRATVEPLEGNKVRLSVEVDEPEFDRAVDRAFRKLAGEVRIPGFRPGKAPRRVLEARFGAGVGRSQALQDEVPRYYLDAVRENDVDVIAAPELKVTEGELEGAVSFEAVVEVRPTVSVAGYGGLRVTVPSPVATDEEVDAQVERLRLQFAELETVERAAADGDVVTVDIAGTRDGEPIPQLTVDEFVYEVGSGAYFPELDENLRGAEAGASLDFAAAFGPPRPARDDAGEEAETDEEDAETPTVDLHVEVKEVRQRVLPDLDDAFANEVSEFDTLEGLRANLTERLGGVKRARSANELREQTGAALASLVEEEIPATLIEEEVARRLQDLAGRLEAQGTSIEEWVSATGRSAEQIIVELRETAEQSVKLDLALRAVADAEAIECTDEDLDAEYAQLAQRTGVREREVRKQFERAQQVPAVRSDIRKRKAFDWLLERVEIVDEDGHSIDRNVLVLEADEVDGVGAAETDLDAGEGGPESAPSAGSTQANDHSEDDE